MSTRGVETPASLMGEPFEGGRRVTYEEFETLVSERGILDLRGADRMAREFFEGYILANNAGGKELDDFSNKVVAHLSPFFLDRKLSPKSTLTIREAMRIGRDLAPKFIFSENGNESNRMGS